MKSPRVRHSLRQAVGFASTFVSAFIFWRGLGLLCGVENPIVIVLSGSMEPALRRGDLLIIAKPSDGQYRVGDVTVFQPPFNSKNAIPIVHRVIQTQLDNNRQYLLTKGDNNSLDDEVLYKGEQRIQARHIKGKVIGYLPYVGHVSILMNDFPVMKYCFLGGFALLPLMFSS